jgi:RNA polymerase sigma-70 factor (ECF subfamily)
MSPYASPSFDRCPSAPQTKTDGSLQNCVDAKRVAASDQGLDRVESRDQIKAARTLKGSRRHLWRRRSECEQPIAVLLTAEYSADHPNSKGSPGFRQRSGSRRVRLRVVAVLIIQRCHRARKTELASYQEISTFLAEVQRRAFKQAMFAVKDEDAALDAVQDAMLKLTEKYSAKPAAELPMLFQRILQNTIHDHFRRQKVRFTWTTLLSAFGQKDEKDDDYDPLETMAAKSDSNIADDPARQVEQGEIVALIEQAVSRLPMRQRQAFLLRYWEELDVAEAAAAMGCSEGSVKTHCSRAVRALADALKAKGISL